jgi:hypothetical protein
LIVKLNNNEAMTVNILSDGGCSIVNHPLGLSVANPGRHLYTFAISVYMLHPIREIAHFMNWPYYACPFHELGNFSAQFMNWAET